MVFTEHFSDHNQQEVKKDLQFLIAQECFKTSTELKNFKQEVSQHFTDENLIKTIQKLFKKDDDCNETATPAHDFITQLCLIRCGQTMHTKIDSDLGEGSRRGILALKKLYNKRFRPTPMRPIPENSNADAEFFKAVIEIIKTTPRPTSFERPVGVDVIDKLESTYFLGHSFVEGYPSKHKLGIRGATINAINKEIRNNPEAFRFGVQGKTLVVDLGINDRYARGATPEQVLTYYKNLIGTIRNPQKGNYQGPIHIIGISEVTKIIQKRGIQESNKRIGQTNTLLATLAQADPKIFFHMRTLGTNISSDGIHARDSTQARNQVLDLVYNSENGNLQNTSQQFATYDEFAEDYGIRSVKSNEGKQKEKPQESQMAKRADHLNKGEPITINDKGARTGTIEQFVPKIDDPIVISYANTDSPYKKYTSVIAKRNGSTYVVVSHMPSREGKRALIYPGTQIMKKREEVVLDKIEPVKPSLLPQKENRVDLSQNTFLTINLVFSSILKKYEDIKEDFVKFVDDFNLNADQIKRLAQLMYAENPSFSAKRKNYTPIGQVGRAARIDGHNHLGVTPPVRSKKNRYNQLTACYGYASKAGIFSSNDQESLGRAYAKYNLGLYHTTKPFSKIKSMFYNQADELVGYAKASARKRGTSEINYQDITNAEYKYYTKGEIGEAIA